MFERSRSRIRWWVIVLVLVPVAVLLLNTSLFSPVRDVVIRATLPVQTALRGLGTSLREITTSVNDLATLRQRNTELENLVTSLTVENVGLREIEAENIRLRRLLNFAQAAPSFEFKGSQVVGRVVAGESNNTVQSILIDVGSRHGVLAGMPVVTERGLVGRVTEVYSTASRVLLITDSNSNVNTVLQNSRLRGILRGRSSLPTLMDYLPPDRPVIVGDIVLTSGEGGNFPAGIPVGQVTQVNRNDVEMFQQAVVRATVDFDTLETVLVVTSFQPISDLETLPEP